MERRRSRTDYAVRDESERAGSDLEDEGVFLSRMKGDAMKVRKKQAVSLRTPQKIF